MAQKVGYRHSKEAKKRIAEGMRRHHQQYDKVSPADRVEIMKLYNNKQMKTSLIAEQFSISIKRLFEIIKEESHE